MSADALPKGGDGVARVLAIKARPRPANGLSASLTLGWRALLKIKHVPFQLFDVTFMPIMMTVMFTYLFGGALAGSPKEYVQYLLPGILVQTIVFITVYTGVGLNTDINKGIYDRFRSLPIWQPSPIFGALMGDVLRYSIAASIVIIVGLLLGFRPQGGPLGVAAAFVLVLFFAFCVSWLWIIISMLVKTPESVMTASFVFLMPLTFMSSIFVDPATMPGWLRAIVNANPVSHLASASRQLMHGQDPTKDLVWVLVASIGILVVAAPLALRMYYRER